MDDISHATLPKTRKAWRAVRQGKPKDALKLETDLPIPTLNEGEVLIRVHAAALNPVGYKLMRSVPNFLARRPQIAEHDFAGVVADSNGSEFANGEYVFGVNSREHVSQNGEGALSDYVKTSSSRLARIPEGMSVSEASGLGIVGTTAVYALEILAKVQPGQSVFINGGGTSVGRAAIQVAKAHGCKVITSCSTNNMDAMKSLGADKVYDYTAKPIHLQLLEAEPIPEYDVVLEAAGIPAYKLYSHSPSYLKKDGIFMSTIPQGTDFGSWMTVVLVLLRGLVLPHWLGGVARKYKMIAFITTKEEFDRLGRLVNDGKLKLIIDSEFQFKDVLSAYDRIMTREAKGKVIVTIA